MAFEPAVSCICLTFGRPQLLEEAIYSFLRQAYGGPKELLVLNDYDQQILQCDSPEVRVVNVPKRLRTVGEKMNMAVALAANDLLFVWDDDDIYLPHRLAFSVDQLERHGGFFKPDKGWMLDTGNLLGPLGASVFHSASCWSRRLFDAVGGYPAEGTGYDFVFETRLRQRYPAVTHATDVRPEDIYYIYRWGGTGSYHMSQFGDYQPGANKGHDEVMAYLQQSVVEGRVQQGYIQLQPSWHVDYERLVGERLRGADEET
jgi:hypothetical protein